WNSTISGLTAVSQVWEEPSSGVIYVVGSGVFNGINRGVVLLFAVFGQTPIPQWVKFLDNNESSYVGGSITLLSANDFAFVDGRSPTSGGFGQRDALMSVNDLQFTTCITDDDLVNVNSVSLTYIAPFLEDIEFFDFPTGTDITSASLNWQQENVCNNNPCNADFIITHIGNCGHYQVTNTSTGAQPLTYSWCDGSTSQDLDVMLPCGPYTFCLTITDANGCTSSYSESVNVVDQIRPTPVCVPGFGVTLDSACQAVILPSMIDGGSTDNCQIQSLSASPAILTGCGLFPVTLTVTDWCGNTNVCVTTIQTIENVPPVIICPPNKTLTTGASNCTLVVNGLHWLSIIDNCSASGFTVTYSVTGATNHTGTGDASGLTFNQGTSIVTYTAFDDCGNSSSCSFTVKVECVCDCVNNKLLNPGFYEGAVAGDLGITGNADHWERYATPQVVPGDSCCDDVSIQMFGWLYNGEAMYQQGMNFLAGHHYKVSFCARFVPNNSYGNNVSFGFMASNGYINPFYCPTCPVIGNSPQIFNSTWASYTLPIWTPTQNWDRFYVRTFNTLAQKSWGRIDNICIQEVGQTCCADRDAFVFNIDNAVNFSFDESTQEGICTIGNLPECDSIGYIDWGDGYIDQGPFGGNTIRRHQFLNHLLARIQYPAFEYNQEVDPAAVCF
ncbi:MAG TPA: HYR domain-containing protein, partial [Saprospiraceae bacterium]|nr:HYR domain-containing protein [Saprospiraceae bacterium]